MPSRPIWRGHLRLALVSCPVALFNARHDRSAIRFNLINPSTGNRVRMVTQDAETHEELRRGDLVKGYEFKKNTYLLLTEEDLESVKVDSSSTMTVEKFVPADSIDPMYYDSSYYMAPDGKAGDDVYAVLREAITKTGMVALSRVVISQRERTIALRPVGAGLMAHTLYEERDLNDSKELLEDVADLKPDPEMVQLATQLIQRQAGQYDPSDIEDRYETHLRELIDAKLRGEGVDRADVEPVVRSNVIDLMAALKKSLGQDASKTDEPAAAPAKRKRPRAQEPMRNQTGLKLPIKGGKAAGGRDAVASERQPAPITKASRKMA